MDISAAPTQKSIVAGKPSYAQSKMNLASKASITKSTYMIKMDSKSPVSTSNVGASMMQKHSKAPDLLQKSLGDYYFDRFEDKIDPYKGLYSSSKVFYAPASEFSLLRQELACLDNQLVNARIAWNDERKILTQRWDNAIAKHHLVQENIPKFNGYYKDSFAKRERANQSSIREREQCELKQGELRRLRKEKQKLEAIKQAQDARLEKFSVFKTYLDKVKQSSQGEYGDIREIIDRYAVLAVARNNLHGRLEVTRENVHRSQHGLERDILMKSNEVLAYNNFLSELMDYQNALHEQVLKLEDNLLRIKTTAAQRTLIIGQIKMAIRNLYLQVCKHMHRNARITLEDTLGQLMDIRISVREMYKLAKDIKHMLRNAYLTAEAEEAAKQKLQRKNDDRQRRIDKLGKRGIVDPRELFGLKRRESGENREKKGMVDGINVGVAGGILNTTVEKTDGAALGIQGVVGDTVKR